MKSSEDLAVDIPQVRFYRRRSARRPHQRDSARDAAAYGIPDGGSGDTDPSRKSDIRGAPTIQNFEKNRPEGFPIDAKATISST